MQNIRSFALMILALLCSSFLAAQNNESSSQSQRPADRPSADPAASPAPIPQTRQRRSVPEVEDAMGKGEDLLFKKHDARASLEEFKRAAKLDPWHGQAYMLQGLAHMQLQEWSEAQWAFEEAAKVEPGNAKAYLGAGSALNEQRNYAAAQKPLQRSLEIRPDLAEAHYELARSLWGLGKWQAAEPHVRQAIELNKDYAGPHALMGNIDIQREDPEAALTEFEECLRLDPEGNLAPSVKEIIAQLKKALGKS
jgi:tetratricopeptide (TPR) repeat protein